MCLMGIVQNLFLAYENTKVMKYIIPENNFDIANIWSLAHGLLQGGLYTIYFKGIDNIWVFELLSRQNRHSPSFGHLL